MVEIGFYPLDLIGNDRLKYAIIAARKDGQWIICRHKERTTWEIPGGHREPGEDIHDTAKRELYEETGAVKFVMKPVCVYSVAGDDERIHNVKPTYGMLFYAQVETLSELPAEMEMAEIRFCKELPGNLTYPQIQPALWRKVKEETDIGESLPTDNETTFFSDSVVLIDKKGGSML